MKIDSLTTTHPNGNLPGNLGLSVLELKKMWIGIGFLSNAALFAEDITSNSQMECGYTLLHFPSVGCPVFVVWLKNDSTKQSGKILQNRKTEEQTATSCHSEYCPSCASRCVPFPRNFTPCENFRSVHSFGLRVSGIHLHACTHA